MTKKKSTYLCKPHNQIAKCIRDESITGLLWAFIQLSQSEIKEAGTTTTFSGSDLSKFVALLHQREVSSKLQGLDPVDDSAVAAWLSASKQTETETKPKQ